MAEPNLTYERKVSGEEVQEGFIFILKDFLHFFPKPDINFKLKVEGEEYEVAVEAYDCWCQGPRKPHVHYKIPIRKFRGKFPIHRGTKVVFTKLEDNVYELKK